MSALSSRALTRTGTGRARTAAEPKADARRAADRGRGRSLARPEASELRVSALAGTRARGTPGPARPTALCAVLVEAHRQNLPQEKPASRRPARGVCRLAPHAPRWAYFSGADLVGTGAYPPLRGTAAAASVRRRQAAPAAWTPVIRSKRTGTVRLGPPPRGAAFAPRAGHRHPAPPTERLRRRPLSSRDAVLIEQKGNICQGLFCQSISLARPAPRRPEGGVDRRIAFLAATRSPRWSSCSCVPPARVPAPAPSPAGATLRHAARLRSDCH